MPIINQVVKGGGGSAPASYVELVNDNGTIKYSSITPSVLTGVTNIPQYMFYDRSLCAAKVSGVLSFPDVTFVGGYAFRDSFTDNNLTFVGFGSLETLNSNYCFENAFKNNKLTGFDFSKLKTVSQNSVFKSAFANNTTLIGDFSFPSLEIIYQFDQCFQYCSGIEFFGFPKCKTLGSSLSSASFSGTFSGCSSLTGINFNALESTPSNYDNTYANSFAGTALTKLRFPMLTNMSAKSFGTNCFSTNTLTEIHFRKDMQTTVEALDNYSTKWGATNATVYFDIVGTLTGADSNTYTRDEYNSVYSDPHGKTQTAVAWKYNGTTYYTPFSANEPAVGDTIYSDSACTTAVTTISSIA